jgi:hypothetical protein
VETAWCTRKIGVGVIATTTSDSPKFG